jgi:hypothetical protein
MAGCSNQNHSAAIKTIDAFYDHYKPGDYRVVDTSLLSKDLSTKIRLAKTKQKEEAEKLKAIGSTDKPPMIEGDIYTSLYEGATKHEIINSKSENNTIKAEVKFVNEFYKNYTWSDTIVLINKDGNWEIDDILYAAKQGSARSIKAVLNDFLNLK